MNTIELFDNLNEWFTFENKKITFKPDDGKVYFFVDNIYF